MNRIFLDLDGVIVNFEKQVTKLFNIDIENKQVRTFLKESDPSRGIADLVGGKSKFWSRVGREGEAFWSEMELLPWGMDLYNDMKKLCPNVFFLTSPSHEPSSLAGKAKFIRTHFKTNNFLIGSPKFACGSKYSLLVDDTPKKINEFKEFGGNIYLFPNQYQITDGDISYETIINQITKIYKFMEEENGRILE